MSPPELPRDPDTAASETAGEDSGAKNRDRSLHRMLVGAWEDDYQGHRTMTLNDDGTGVMIVELSGLTASLFASRLRFDMEWSGPSRTLEEANRGGRAGPAGADDPEDHGRSRRGVDPRINPRSAAIAGSGRQNKV